MTIGSNIKKLRTSNNLTQEEFGNIADVSAMAVSQWENGRSVPRMGAIQRIADYFKIPKSEILEGDYSYAAIPLPSDTFAPVVGRVHAGEACEAIQDTHESEWVSPRILERHQNVYYLKVIGDSMDKIFPEGSLALVDKDADVDDGDIAVVFVNGEEATIKRVFFAGDTLVLHPESFNDDHFDRAISRRDPEAPEVRIEGKVVWYFPRLGNL